MKRMRVFLFENAMGHAHIEELLEDDRVISTYVVFLPHDSDRFPSREVPCANVSEALIALSAAADLIKQPYAFARWWTNDESDIDIDDFWCNRTQRSS